jgi:hypothetical protein
MGFKGTNDCGYHSWHRFMLTEVHCKYENNYDDASKCSVDNKFCTLILEHRNIENNQK